MNIDLFQRNGRKEMLPTKQADLLYERTLVLLEEWEETQQNCSMNKMKKKYVGSLLPHLCCLSLPQLMKHLIKRFPKVHFEIEITNSHESLEQVAKHESDFGFIEKPLETSGVQRYSLMEDQLVIAGDPKSKLWLVREANSGVFHYTQRYFEEMNIQDKKMIVKSNDVIVALLKEGIGRSILSKRSVPENVPMTPLNFHRYFYFIQRTNLVSDQLLEIAEEILRYNESTETSHSEENLSW